MGKSAHNDVIDNGPEYVQQNADKLVICENEPTTYAEANTAKGSGGYKLAEVAVDSSDFTNADGDVSGRKLTVGAQTSTVSVTGDADHVALLDTGNSKLLLVTTITQQTITSGNTWNLAAFDQEVADPT